MGTLQLTVVPGLSRRGPARAQAEAVRVQAEAAQAQAEAARVHDGERGTGLGTAFMEWAERAARARGAVLVRPTSDRARGNAHRFHERLGCTPAHLGFKKPLD